MSDLDQQLQDRFGLEEFRPSQREVIEDVLAGKDVLCVMPTGAGKSLCYQLPATISGGLTIVVSPLISLMEDQVQQLRDQGIPAALLNSSLSAAMQREAIAQIEQGFEGLLYVAPERFFAPNFRPLLKNLKVKLLAIDEAHCVSHWGHDFRPEYSCLGEVRQDLGLPPTIALTATATDDVREDIIHGLMLREPTVVITGFDRPNLLYQCRHISKIKEKDAALIDLLRSVKEGSAIVYCSTRKNVDELVPYLSRELRGRPVFAYHAGMDADARTKSQEAFMQSSLSVAVATNAFGMGINKPDTRLVVHYNIPGTLEAYYQEAGRAGRDGAPASCMLFYSYQDRMIQEFFITKIGQQQSESDPEIIATLKDRASDKLQMMIRYAQTHHCRRQMILDYFGDEADVIDCHCDVCDHSASPGSSLPGTALSDEVVTLVRQILSAIARINGKFGVGALAEMLTGSENERVLRWQLHQLSVYGLLKRYPLKKVIAMVHRVIESGLARQKNVSEENPIHVLELSAVGVSVMKGEQQPPTSLADLIPKKSGPRASGTNPRALGTNPRAARGKSRADKSDRFEDDVDDPQTSEMFERLRAARMNLARERDLPPYCICHDSTLRLIARARPDTLDELEEVKGMGPHKVKMYGPKLIEAIKGS